MTAVLAKIVEVTLPQVITAKSRRKQWMASRIIVTSTPQLLYARKGKLKIIVLPVYTVQL